MEMAQHTRREGESAGVHQRHVVLPGVDQLGGMRVHALEVGKALPPADVVQVEASTNAWPEHEREHCDRGCDDLVAEHLCVGRRQCKEVDAVAASCEGLTEAVQRSPCAPRWLVVKDGDLHEP